MKTDALRLGSKITLLPVIHGSGDFSVAVRRLMLEQSFDCLAVPLPPSFQEDVETAIERLPSITAVIQSEPRETWSTEWTPDSDQEDDDEVIPPVSYVPIDPCQPVIAALRIALQERTPRAYIDLEVEQFDSRGTVLPDPYALKTVSLEQFSAAVLPTIPPLPEGQPRQRVAKMAERLRELETRHESILCLCSVTDWPWIREAWHERRPVDAETADVEETQICRVAEQTLLFLLGELPFITGLYERARYELDDDENLSIDGIKAMLLAARTRYREDFGNRARKISPHMLRTYLRYVRNLTLVERRFTPDLYTLIVAAQQIAGDQFAIHLTETARSYPFIDDLAFPQIEMGIGRVQLPDGTVVPAKSRLPGPPVTWRSCQLNRQPQQQDKEKWQMQWNPFRQCSWPPEDVAIERFRTHVKDHALRLLGNDLARSEKFTTSLKDGLDIRETLRNWHTGDLYVKVVPPSRGSLDCVLMLFDSPADPREYPWRITWHAEHHDESTLSFFATSFQQEVVGPGIAMSTYGGAMFLFPPRPIPDVWKDPRFDFTDTMEERLLAAACHHSNERHIALLADGPPGAGWRRLAKRFGKRLVHVPLAHFSQETVQQLRMFHVLNGRQVRSYAAHFIRHA
ncbi:hypothetical protein [Maioricimonas sp. JC845]|uniref:hypothetical protein n=1 Tax=Maioricimonas sp. JC845 TaxID=3232138 RepID=UPI00345801E1